MKSVSAVKKPAMENVNGSKVQEQRLKKKKKKKGTNKLS